MTPRREDKGAGLELLQGDLSMNFFIILMVILAALSIAAVATVTDHVAPWKSVYKINDLFNTEITFVLTSGGHNAGIVSEPGHPRRNFQIGLQRAEDKHIPPDQWLQQHEKHQGSWWEPWVGWLESKSSPGHVLPPTLGNPDDGVFPLCDAPGNYVMEK